MAAITCSPFRREFSYLSLTERKIRIVILASSTYLGQSLLFLMDVFDYWSNELVDIECRSYENRRMGGWWNTSTYGTMMLLLKLPVCQS
jgi:hypothetical protein